MCVLELLIIRGLLPFHSTSADETAHSILGVDDVDTNSCFESLLMLLNPKSEDEDIDDSKTESVTTGAAFIRKVEVGIGVLNTLVGAVILSNVGERLSSAVSLFFISTSLIEKYPTLVSGTENEL